MRFKKEKIKQIDNQILQLLKEKGELFTSHIAKEVGKDFDFIMNRMVFLFNKNKVDAVVGSKFTRRFKQRRIWILSQKTKKELKNGKKENDTRN